MVITSEIRVAKEEASKRLEKIEEQASDMHDQHDRTLSILEERLMQIVDETLGLRPPESFNEVPRSERVPERERTETPSVGSSLETIDETQSSQTTQARDGDETERLAQEFPDSVSVQGEGRRSTIYEASEDPLYVRQNPKAIELPKFRNIR